MVFVVEVLNDSNELDPDAQMIDALALVKLDVDLALDVFAVHEDWCFEGVPLLVFYRPVLSVLHLLDFYVNIARGGQPEKRTQHFFLVDKK